VKIKLYGTKGSTNGIGAVSIDGGAETNLDFYNATILGDQLMWTSPQLSDSSHTLKLRVTGSKNTSASDRFVAPDRVVVTASTTCTVESDAAFCSRLAKNCGTVTDTDNCGKTRTVSSCGGCSSGLTCNQGACSSSPSNQFTNPTFAGGTTGWTTRYAPGCTASFATSTTAQDGDAKAAKVTIGSCSNPWWDNIQVLQVKAGNGRPYTLSAYFRKSEGTSKKVTVFCSENTGHYTIYSSKVCTNSSGWTKCSVTCNAPAGEVKFGIAFGDSDVDTIIDTMSLTQ
jgi:hypothetical protein